MRKDAAPVDADFRLHTIVPNVIDSGRQSFRYPPIPLCMPRNRTHLCIFRDKAASKSTPIENLWRRGIDRLAGTVACPLEWAFFAVFSSDQTRMVIGLPDQGSNLEPAD